MSLVIPRRTIHGCIVAGIANRLSIVLFIQSLLLRDNCPYEFLILSACTHPLQSTCVGTEEHRYIDIEHG